MEVIGLETHWPLRPYCPSGSGGHRCFTLGCRESPPDQVAKLRFHQGFLSDLIVTHVRVRNSAKGGGQCWDFGSFLPRA
eukprot:1666854-Amphidinium_carterae.1